jgi:hypothetical protein
MAKAKIESWEKLHRRSERQLETAVAAFLQAQNARILEALGPSLIPAGLDLSLSSESEGDELWAAVEDILAAQMAAGAVRMRGQADDATSRRTTALGTIATLETKAFSFSPFKLAASVIDGINSSLDSVKNTGLWSTIAGNRIESVKKSLSSMIQDGLSIPNMTKKLQSILPKMGRSSAKAIARTEATGSLNAGSYAQLLALADQIHAKEWIGLLDRRIRPDHLTAHGQKRKVRAMFRVGGERCPYPGYHGLSARQRIRCRCTFTAVFEVVDDEELAAGGENTESEE